MTRQILIFSENENIGYELLSKGLELSAATGAEVTAAVLGADMSGRVEEYLARGAKKVYVPQAGKELLQTFDAGVYAEALAQMAKKAQETTVLLGCTRCGKEIAGQLAQKLGAGCINDVNNLQFKDGKLVCERYALGGAVVSVQAVVSPMAVISVMPAVAEQAAKGESAGQIVEIDLELKPSRIRMVEQQRKATDAVDIAEAKTLVCVGMGLNSEKDLPMFEELAKLLEGEIACTKPVCSDHKWLSEARMVGLSGKKCKPQLGICVGISGQVQFLVGIQDARVIVAINNDEKAYMFQVCDYGIVGDFNEVVPKLAALLKK